MNTSDSEIVASVLQSSGWEQTDELDAAQLVLINTCAIREKAETTVFNRLRNLRHAFAVRDVEAPVVGVLGCMAERLKTKLMEQEQLVQLVAGPDAYRDLPRLVDIVRTRRRDEDEEELLENAVNVQLSADETYADIAPVRAANGSKVSAFATVMRGCNNMCSFCIVPFTRGRERARSSDSIMDEVQRLSDTGYKEVVLLGQNVNSYWDKAEGRKATMLPAPGHTGSAPTAVEGFSNLYRLRGGDGVRFAELLSRVADVDPEMRVRFTSPHPKDFPPELLQVIAERSNVCAQLHLPVQSGSTSMLQRMRRGYSNEAFLALAEHARATIPGVTLSTDVIVGFCGETEEEHADTVALMKAVRFEQAYMYMYSMREHTRAARKFEDDVAPALKKQRLAEVIAAYRSGAALQNAREVRESVSANEDSYHVVLVEGVARKSTVERPTLTGRTDTNKRVVLDATPVPRWAAGDDAPTGPAFPLIAGDYALARVVTAGVATLMCEPVAITTLCDWDALLRRGVAHSAAVRAAEDSPGLYL
jgi:MiaB/RimO family radical SAM methylthiotransferase